MLARKTPIANSGTEATTVLKTRMARSSHEPSRMPASDAEEHRERHDQGEGDGGEKRGVAGARSQMISRTGTLKRVEKPRSPEAILPRYST